MSAFSLFLNHRDPSAEGIPLELTMHDALEVRARRIAYRWHRRDEPAASHEDGLTHAALCWQDYLDVARQPTSEDEPERLLIDAD